MSRKAQLLAYLESHASATGRELREHLDLSRQALNAHLKPLIASRRVVKSGSTRDARYYSPARAPMPSLFRRRLPLAGLDESRVYEQVRTTLNLRTALRRNVEPIVHYAFTEMLNNAIEHSEADRGYIEVRLEAGVVSFEVRERGIGVFHSVASKCGLEDEYAAMIELMKGKTTTMPEAHTGEGIFFTTKVADRFVLRSHRIQIEWDRQRDDAFVSAPRFVAGTCVRFMVRRDARHRIEDLFAQFAPEDYDFQFQKTKVHVKLLQSDYVSRSEARRLVANLEKFREVVLDFKDVQSVGQGFADEVFRVFAKQHPGIQIKTVNTSPGVAAMLRHAGAE